MDFVVNNKRCTSLEDVKLSSSVKFYNFVCEYFNGNNYIEAHTSGSTGKPKKIRLDKKDVIKSARNTNRYFDINAQSLLYLNLSPDYIAGKMMIVRAIVANASIIEEGPSNNPLSIYTGQPIDLIALVPSQLIALFNNPDRLQYIKTMIIGGGVIPMSLKRKILDYKLNAYSTYGMTETCSHVALSKIIDDNNIYELIGEYNIKVDNRDCLVLLSGDKEIVTNDIIEFIDDKHFRWKGRYDNVINTGGIKVFPEQIEPIIAECIKNVKFFVTGIPSEKWGEEVVLVFEYSSLEVDEIKIGQINERLMIKLRTLLQDYSLPHRYIALKTFKYTSTGKLIRHLDINRYL
ncbi:MAG: AMP-binding protein [Muribaculaceae bacterium]|nr:AMP-binding protein [Muribaculaceae bacterium]